MVLFYYNLHTKDAGNINIHHHMPNIQVYNFCMSRRHGIPIKLCIEEFVIIDNPFFFPIDFTNTHSFIIIIFFNAHKDLLYKLP
jgi:hypothetical protein